MPSSTFFTVHQRPLEQRELTKPRQAKAALSAGLTRQVLPMTGLDTHRLPLATAMALLCRFVVLR
jgi:hypothetical protein